jgi:pilus assembly protein CpaB
MKSLILIFIALGCGLVASIGISQVMDGRKAGGGSMEMEQILVALVDLDIGTKLTAQNVKLEEWPKNKVPEGAIRALEDVKDKFANSRFYKGEALHVSKVADQLGNIAIKIPEGYRAMPVKVDEDTVLKAISPGDKVDVIVFLRRNGEEIPVTGAFPVLKNVRVFAVNTNTERATDGKGESANFRTVSLLVKEEHTGELVVAAQMGKILLTLRRPDQKDEVGGEEATPIKEILAGKSKSQSDPVAQPQQPKDGDFLSFAAGAGAGQTGSGGPGDPKFRMTIIGPDDRKEFVWYDDKGLPVEVGGGSSSSSGPSVSTNNQSSSSSSEDKSSGDNSPSDSSKSDTPSDSGKKSMRKGGTHSS